MILNALKIFAGLVIFSIIIYILWMIVEKFEDPFKTKCKENEKGKTPINSPCDRDCLCKNGVCGRLTAKDGAETVCCPSGKKDTYALNDYCIRI